MSLSLQEKENRRNIALQFIEENELPNIGIKKFIEKHFLHHTEDGQAFHYCT